MPTRSTLVTVSEPTMHDGIWTLAQFRWRGLSRFTDQDIEEACANALTVMLTRETDSLKATLDDWLRGLPEVDEWCEPLHQVWQHDFATDTYSLRAKASGWFILSDDEAKTENMLKQVDCETVGGMRARLFDARPLSEMTAEFATRAARESLLRVGTVNNDINPDFSTDNNLITEPLRYRRQHHRWDVNWTNWRGLYGTLEDSQRDASVALRAMIDAAAANHPVDERLPDESSAPTLPDTTSSDGGGT